MTPKSQWHHIGDPPPKEPNLEVFWEEFEDPEKRGWYWWLIEPGSMPEAPAHGPYISAKEAIEAATPHILLRQIKEEEDFT